MQQRDGLMGWWPAMVQGRALRVRRRILVFRIHHSELSSLDWPLDCQIHAVQWWQCPIGLWFQNQLEEQFEETMDRMVDTERYTNGWIVRSAGSSAEELLWREEVGRY